MAKAAIHFHAIGTVVVVQPEVMGQAYLDEYRRGQLKECAKRLGLDLDYLENLKRISFALRPRNEDTEGDSSDEERGDEESAGGMLGGSR
ncbi:unnamed protein product, partial [Laminaria digitata]